MSELDIESSTQRIIVGRNGALKIVYAGPRGPRGLPSLDSIIVGSAPFADRPSAVGFDDGALYLATDENTWYKKQTSGLTEHWVAVAFNSSASGTVSSPMLVWVASHNLHFKPSGMRFTSLDGLTELEPDNITHINDDVVSVEWLTARTGMWEFS